MSRIGGAFRRGVDVAQAGHLGLARVGDGEVVVGCDEKNGFARRVGGEFGVDSVAQPSLRVLSLRSMRLRGVKWMRMILVLGMCLLNS